MKAAYGPVVNVKPIPSRGVTRIEIEIPVEGHVHATEMLFGQNVLVVVASPAVVATEVFGILDPDGEDRPERVEPEKGWASYGPLAKSAIMVCKEDAFQRFVAEMLGRGDGAAPCVEEVAASYVKERCLVASRKEIDTKDGAKERFGALMAEYRLWQDRL